MYGVLYIASGAMGLGLSGMPYWLSFTLLTVTGVFSIFLAFKENKWLLLFVSIFWGLSGVANWMKLIPYTPPFSEFQFTVMALLDLVQAVVCATLSGVFNK
jgi:hypothetical protein